MEEPEVPTEHLHEAINERAEEEKDERKWTMYVAISTALMAVFAAISSMLAGHHSNEALIEQIKASDQWNYYQAKGIKADIAANSVHAADPSRLQQYAGDQARIKSTAEEYEHSSAEHLEKHVTLAKSVTLLQIAIAISAISVLTRKRVLWYASVVLAMIGVVFFIVSFL